MFGRSPRVDSLARGMLGAMRAVGAVTLAVAVVVVGWVAFLFPTNTSCSPENRDRLATISQELSASLGVEQVTDSSPDCEDGAQLTATLASRIPLDLTAALAPLCAKDPDDTLRCVSHEVTFLVSSPDPLSTATELLVRLDG